MPAESEPNPKMNPGTLKDLTHTVARQLAAGHSQEHVIQQLIARGWPAASAQQFVANARRISGMYRAAATERVLALRHCRGRILRGLLGLLVGLSIGAFGLSLADTSTSLFLFAVGVILCVFGVVDFLFGLSC
jgi:hypothetical protein